MKIMRVLVTIPLLISAMAFSADLDLKFTAEIDTGSEELILPDRLVIQTTEILDPNNLLHINLLQPPPPPDHDYARIAIDSLDTEIRRQMIHDPNTMLLLAINLIVNDADQSGISGKSIVTLDNPQALDGITDDMLVYLRRYDHEGRHIGNYDLADPANQTIEWQITNQLDKYATLELIAEKKSSAADLDDTDMVDLVDFAAVASAWHSQVPLDGTDVYKDAVMDINDLLIVVEVWLSSLN